MKKPKKVQKKNNRIEQNQRESFSFEDQVVIGVTVPRKQKVQNENKAVQMQKQIPKKKKQQRKKKRKKEIKSQVKLQNNMSEEEIYHAIQKRKRKLCILKYTSLCILLITAIMVAMFSPLFHIKTITIQGNQKITKQQILSLSNISLEENTFKINKNKVIEKIKENAYIETVTIKRRLPSELQIIVTERETEFLIEYAGGYVYLDKYGYILEISSQKLELPIIQGVQTPTSALVEGNRLETTDLEKWQAVLKIMESAKNNEIDTLITRIDIEDDKNYKIVFESKEKTAYLGDDSNLNTKMLNIKGIIEQEEGIAGEILVNVDLNSGYPIFRQRV